MNLADQFFSRIIPAKLNKPTYATLHLDDGEAPIMATVVLKIGPTDNLAADFHCLDLEAGPQGEPVHDKSANFALPRLLKASLEIQPITVRFYSSYGMTRDIEAVVKTVSGNDAEGRLAFPTGDVKIQDSQIRQAWFCTVDYPKFIDAADMYGITTTYPESSNSTASRIWRRLGRVKIDAAGWKVTIEECADKDEFGITHNGHIKKTDGADFSICDLEHLLEGLVYFSAFVTGVYRYPSIVIADDKERHAVWGRIRPFNQPRYANDNWFSPFHGASMSELFPGFWKNFTDRHDEICHIILSYAESSMIAHTGLHNHALTVSQSALEALSNWSLKRGMKREKSESDGGSVRESAAAYIQESLMHEGISCDLSEYPTLLNLWQCKYKVPDDGDTGPQFITRLRNTIHKPTLSQQGDRMDYYEAWRLSQHYVELMLLKLCNYSGYYRNRLTPDERVQYVPWASDTGQ